MAMIGLLAIFLAFQVFSPDLLEKSSSRTRISAKMMTRGSCKDQEQHKGELQRPHNRSTVPYGSALKAKGTHGQTHDHAYSS